MTDPMDARQFLVLLAQIPHLLDQARQQGGLDRYAIQKSLREQHRRAGLPFLYSMPMRHLVRCPQCAYSETDVLHELEDPRRGMKMEFTQLLLHRAEAHALPADDDLAEFLAGCLGVKP